MGWMTHRRANAASPELGNDAPPDVANLAYLIYFCLGAGLLLPWNSFITAVDYFEYLYPHQNIDRVFTVSYIFPCLIVLCFLTVYGQHYSSWVRINSGLVLYLLAIVLVPAMHALFIGVNERGSSGTYCFTVGTLLVTGVADALVQGSLIGSAGELPERYMQAVVSGTAASGVLVSLLRITTKAALPRTPIGLRFSTNVYFGVSGTFLVLCLVSYNMTHKLPVIHYYQTEKLKLVPVRAETEPLIRAAEEDVEGEEEKLKFPSSAIGLSRGREILDKGSYVHALRQLRWLAGALIFIYVITYSIFPGFLSEDVHSVFFDDWYPVLLLTSVNVFDLVGKVLTAVYILDSRAVLIWGPVGRILFIPLFGVCLHGPHVLRTEAPMFVLTSLLGVTNGYFTSCLMIAGPKSVPFAESETAGIVMTISLVLGLAIGSGVSWFWEV